MITRRDALKHLGLMTGAAVIGPELSGCNETTASTGPEGITTIVVLCMENRSFDHYLGARALEGRGGDGIQTSFSNPNRAGSDVPVFAASAACVADPPHGWQSSRAQFNRGANDGFMKAYQQVAGNGIAPHVMGYLTRESLPATYALADASTMCDRWFCSVMGPTWPNRLFLHSGQSGGMTTNEIPAEGRFTWRSIWHQLTDKGVPWRYYYGDLPFLSLWQESSFNDSVRSFDVDFFLDAQNGKLPPVVYIDPTFGKNDDHPPHHPVFGQQLIASIYAALAASPQWKNVLFVVTYDEHGGFFDHVPPPLTADDRASEGFDQLGFRVPAIVAGPYVKQGAVSSTLFDHTSVLAHIGKMHGLEPLTARVAAANDLSSVLDDVKLAAKTPAPPVTLPAIVVDEAAIESMCAVRLPQSELEQFADRGGVPPTLDRRRFRRDSIFAIADRLAMFNAGGRRRPA